MTAPGARRGRPARRGAGQAADAPRRVAFDLLRAVDERGAYANLLLPQLVRERGLTGRDAAFATELAYGTLRGQGRYDLVLARCVDRPLEALDAALRDVLRLGAHQLLGGLRVPPHAAVAATVDLAREVVGAGPARLSNAVLRRVSESSAEDWLDRVAPAPEDDPVGHLAVRFDHPRWVAQAFLDALSGDLDELATALESAAGRPRTHLVARPGRISRDALLAEAVEAGLEVEPGRLSAYAVVLAAGDPRRLPAVRDGRAGVQDEGSQLVGLALAAPPAEGAERRWLDLCAGPGGKAALLDGLAAQREALLVAADRRPHRARLVADALGRGRVVVADGRDAPWPPGSFDRVLVDAPCTGLGALRRRPEVRWRRQPSDVAGLAPLQRALLHSAVELTRPGGVVCYATCSPVLAEAQVVVDDVVRQRGDVARLDARDALPGVPGLGTGPDVQLWPHRHGTDAMFVALLRRHPSAGG